ncbi:hypothetical protein RUM44_002162 [Polyplax serrata]|uniref:Uncharacterized protein n=1 Tax=Polyplax serrata TaxID=468196 RepID=A0ABR1AM24_POLSC
MGEIKSKTSQDLSGRETWSITRENNNVNKLIVEQEESRIFHFKGEPKRLLGSRKREKKKYQNVLKYKNNNNNNIHADGKVNNLQLECCKTEAEMGPRQRYDDVDDTTVTIKKKDSIDNIIDMIVSKSIRRDETLQRILADADRKAAVKRSRSFHGKEGSSRYPIRLRLKNGKRDTDSLVERLENLEKRAMVFERGVGRMGDWVKGPGARKQRSRCSAISEEFGRNMIEVLEENYKCDEFLHELKTIERIRPFERTTKKDKLIAAPKADPIIRNSIRKIVLRVTRCQMPEDRWNVENAYGWDDVNKARGRKVHSKESLLENGWVIVESQISKTGTGYPSDVKSKSVEPLVKSNLRNGVANGHPKDLPNVTGKIKYAVGRGFGKCW